PYRKPAHMHPPTFPSPTLFRPTTSRTTHRNHAGTHVSTPAATTIRHPREEPPLAPRTETSRCRADGPAASVAGSRHGGTGSTGQDRKSTRLNSSHVSSSYAVVC